MAGQALGRTATGIRAVNGVWEIEWHTRQRHTTREEKARFVWDSLSAVVAGPVGVLLGVEVSRHGRLQINPADRVPHKSLSHRNPRGDKEGDAVVVRLIPPGPDRGTRKGSWDDLVGRLNAEGSTSPR